MAQPKWELPKFESEAKRALELMAKAKISASQIFNDCIQAARDLLGNRPRIQQAISSWTQVTGAVTQASNSIAEVKAPVRYYWEGGAAIAFTGWLDEVQNRNLSEWKDTTSTKIIQALNKSSAAVVTFLDGLADALITLILGLADAIGSGISGWAKRATDPGAMIEAATKALNAFGTSAQKLFSAALTALNSFDEAGNDIQAAATALSNIVEPSTGLSDMGVGDPIPGNRR
jgi:hypothetical protein